MMGHDFDPVTGQCRDCGMAKSVLIEAISATILLITVSFTLGIMFEVLLTRGLN